MGTAVDFIVNVATMVALILATIAGIKYKGLVATVKLSKDEKKPFNHRYYFCCLLVVISASIAMLMPNSYSIPGTAVIGILIAIVWQILAQLNAELDSKRKQGGDA